MAGGGGGFLLIDAGVLIDFRESDPSVLPLISARLGRLHVALPVLEEVKGLDKRHCTALELTLVEPTPGQMAEAAAGFGHLSFQDRICLILARANGWTCITNDTALRRECQAVGVKVLWGLEILALLVDGGVLTVDRAKKLPSRFTRPIHTTSTRAYSNGFMNESESLLMNLDAHRQTVAPKRTRTLAGVSDVFFELAPEFIPGLNIFNVTPRPSSIDGLVFYSGN